MDADDVKKVVDEIFVALEKHYVGYPMFGMALEAMQAVIDTLLPSIIAKVAGPGRKQ